MTFEKLPDPVLAKILSQFPFEEYVRIGRVSKCFRRMSIEVISRTKKLDFAYRPSNPRRLTPEALSSILQLCHTRLKTIRFSSHYDFRNPALLATLAEFTCPKLIELDIGTAEIGINVMEALLRNNPNLRVLRWDKMIWSETEFPDVTCEKLETLHVYVCYERHIRMIAGRYSNLKEFKTCIPVRVTKEAWDGVFTHRPRLETFHLSYGHGGSLDLNVDPSAPFWRLAELRTLGMHVYDDDEVLIRLGNSFRKLQHLDLYVGGISSRGVAALGGLKELRRLYVLRSTETGDIDEGLSRLTECKHLQRIDAYFVFSAATLLAIVRSCSELQHVTIRSLREAGSEEALVTFIQSLGGLCTSRLTKLSIRLRAVGSWDPLGPWESEAVKAALQQMAMIEGQTIKLVFGEDEDKEARRWRVEWWERQQ